MTEPGQVLAGRYRIESVLGQGGMGAVYLATMEALGGKKVAIKEMELRGLSQRELDAAVAQFRSEAKLLAHLEHPNLVAVTDFFVEADKHYLVMAYVPGETLQQRLRQRGRPFSWAQIKEWAQPLGAVLTYLHTQDPPILFRDLKPSNVMVESSGRVKLIDFGIARTGQEGEKTSTFLRGTGTSGFSPIEQYGGGQSTDQRSDIYSLAATLYQLMTGKIPPDAVSRISQGAEVEPPSRVNPQLPKALDAIFLKALAISKGERQSTVEEFLLSLDSVGVESEEEGSTEDLGGTIGTPAPKPTFEVQLVPASEPMLSRVPWGALGAISAAVLALLLGLTLGPKLRGETSTPEQQLRVVNRGSVALPEGSGPTLSGPGLSSHSGEEGQETKAVLSPPSGRSQIPSPIARPKQPPSQPKTAITSQPDQPKVAVSSTKNVENWPRDSYPTAPRRVESVPPAQPSAVVEERATPVSVVESPTMPVQSSSQPVPDIREPGRNGRPPVPDGMPSPVSGPDGRPWPPPQGGFPGEPPSDGSHGPYNTRDSYRGGGRPGR